MIEATRWIRIVRHSGRTVTVCTPYPELFEGSERDDIRIITIPHSIKSASLYKFSAQSRKFLRQEQGVKSPLIFPINAHMPLYSLAGNKANSDLIQELVAQQNSPQNIRYFEYETRVWRKHAVHQLQAMQVVATTLGFDDTAYWENFPPVYLQPNQASEESAENTIRNFIPNRYEGRFPIFVHPGVDPSPSKLRTKFYPEEQWVRLVNEMNRVFGDSIHLNFLAPLTPDQADMTGRLADYSNSVGLSTSFVPFHEIDGWNMGSFVSFAQKVASKPGIMLGMDSLAAGHLFPAYMPSVVLGSYAFNPLFYCPPDRALVVMPLRGRTTDGIQPEQVITAINDMSVLMRTGWNGDHH